MAIFDAFDKRNHFSELSSPLFVQDGRGATDGVLTPAERKALCLQSLGLGSGTASVDGTVTTSATTSAAEYSNGVRHRTVLTLTSFALGTAPDNAALAFGAKVYTFPAGRIMVEGATIAGGVTAALSNTAQTPEVGLGTVIGSGASATLSTTMEDFVDGGAAGIIGGASVAPDVAGTAFVKGMLATSKSGVYIASSGGKSHDVFLNVAATWADVTAAGAATFTGTIILDWYTF